MLFRVVAEVQGPGRPPPGDRVRRYAVKTREDGIYKIECDSSWTFHEGMICFPNWGAVPLEEILMIKNLAEKEEEKPLATGGIVKPQPFLAGTGSCVGYPPRQSIADLGGEAIIPLSNPRGGSTETPWPTMPETGGCGGRDFD